MTSSGGAVFHFPVPDGYTFTEADWNTQATLTSNTYFYSKRLAEQALWEAARAQPNGVAGPPGVVVVNPLYVVGPSLTPKLNSSQTLTKRMLMGEAAPQPGFVGFVDVRDAADAHILALEHPDAPGHRIFACAEVAEWKYLALTFKEAFPHYPNVVNLDSELKKASFSFDTAPLHSLGFPGFRSIRQSLIDMVDEFIAHGFVPDLRNAAATAP